MMIIDPVALGDVAFTRPSPKWVFDKTGTLVQVPAGAFAISYDPGNLTKAPFALIEPAATNLARYSDSIFTTWSSNGGSFINAAYSDPRGGMTASRWTIAAGNGKYYTPPELEEGATYTVSAFVRFVSGTGRMYLGRNTTYIIFDPATGDFSFGGIATGSVSGPDSAGYRRVSVTFTVAVGSTKAVLMYGYTGANLVVDVFGIQIEAGGQLTSYISASGSAVTRAADAVASGSGLVYSNVAITETAYSGATTYAKDAVVYDPATYLLYQSLVAGNVGKALTDTASWSPLLTKVNRWSMFDQYNNTQTSNADEIIVVIQPQALAQGVYIGNVDTSDLRISTYDPTDGLVHQETQDLIISDSGSSFYNWCFKRIRRKSYGVSVQLPPYYSGLVTISIRKPGGTPRCGMCVLGPIVDIGLARSGLSREIKDYSTVNFNFDGTSNVVKRNFAKVMDVDVLVENQMIDSVLEWLEGYRQKPLAWIGSTAYGSACLYGTYTSFKNVIQYTNHSVMNLQIQGTV